MADLVPGSLACFHQSNETHICSEDFSSLQELGAGLRAHDCPSLGFFLLSLKVTLEHRDLPFFLWG